MIERIAEAIRKYQAIIDLERNPERKKAMIVSLAGIKASHENLVKLNAPCPPDLIDSFSESIGFIEEMYNKIASN